MAVTHRGLDVEWFGNATVRLAATGGPVAYLDPGRYGALEGYEARDGDVVCVTHAHHYAPEEIERVAAPDATVVAYGGMDLAGSDRDLPPPTDLPYTVETVGASDHVAVGGVDVWTVPAHNDPDGPHVDDDGEPYHPEGTGVGYRLSIEGVSAFWPGDTDVLPGHDRVEVSLLLPPIGGAVTMDRHAAADLAEAMAPDLVLPVHYDVFEGLEADAAAFAADVAERGVPVALDEDGAT